jgi:hypothetical protein
MLKVHMFPVLSLTVRIQKIWNFMPSFSTASMCVLLMICIQNEDALHLHHSRTNFSWKSLKYLGIIKGVNIVIDALARHQRPVLPYRSRERNMIIISQCVKMTSKCTLLKYRCCERLREQSSGSSTNSHLVVKQEVRGEGNSEFCPRSIFFMP